MNQGRTSSAGRTFTMDQNLSEQTRGTINRARIERRRAGSRHAVQRATTARCTRPRCACLAIRKTRKKPCRRACFPRTATCRRFERRSQFSTWLTRIVINAALMRRRSKRARPAVSLDDSRPKGSCRWRNASLMKVPTPSRLYAGTELGDRVSKKLAEISPLLRTAFWLREIEGLSAEEAAHVLGVSRNTLKARLWRARQELAARLGLALMATWLPQHNMAHYNFYVTASKPKPFPPCRIAAWAAAN